MIITISGTAGSGKSTLAKLLANKLGYKHYSMGDFQRVIAKEKGISITELGELEKKDDAIDRMVDEKQKKLGQLEDNFVIDAWLSPLFIPHSFKVFLDADLKTRAKRIAKKRQAESYDKIEDAMNAIQQREKTNRERWLRYYKYDFKDKNNYDLIVDSSDKSINVTLNLVFNKVKKVT